MPQAISNLLTQRRRMKDFLTIPCMIGLFFLSLQLETKEKNYGSKGKL